MFEEIRCKDHPSEFFELPKETQRYVLSKINEHLRQIKNINRNFTSYGLKHLIQKEKFGDLYLTNGQFKGAMLVAGYKAANTSELNWCFNVSQKAVNNF